MKKLMYVAALMLLLSTMLFTGCRDPLVEGAIMSINRGEYEAAKTNLLEAVAKTPGNAEAWYRLGTIYAHEEDFLKMNEAFDKSLNASPTYKTEITNEREKQFADFYNTALNNYYKKARESEDPIVKKKTFAAAAEKFLKAHQIQPQRPEPLTPMSVSFLESGDTTTAEKYMLKAVETEEADDMLLVSIGDFFYKIDKTEKARELYLKALKKNENSVAGHLALGQMFAEEKNNTEAIKHFDLALNLDPENVAIPLNIAIMLYNDQKYTDAIPYIEKVLALDANNKDMTELLSISYLQLAQKEMNQFNETEKQKFKDAAVKIYTDAIPMLEKAVQDFPSSSLLWNNLGVCYAQTNQKAKAEAAFAKQKELDAN